jgi:hypothetical protein
MKITIITKDDLEITYKGVLKYGFNNDVISISHTFGEYSAAYTDHYKFRDIKGLIINTKRAKDEDKR